MVFAVFEEFCVDVVQNALLNCLLECFVLRGYTAAICLVPVSCSHYSSPLAAFICMYQHIAIDISKAACLHIAVLVEGLTFMLGAEPKIRIPESALFKAGAL